MRFFLIGLLLGIVITSFIQFQYEYSINTWLIVIGIILSFFVVISAFAPPLFLYSSALLGFILGIIFILAIWMFSSEIQGLFSSGLIIGFILSFRF